MKESGKESINDEMIMQQVLALRDRGRQLGLSDQEIFDCFDTSPISKVVRKYTPSLFLKQTRIRALWRRSKSQRAVSILTSPFLWAVIALGVGLSLGGHTYISDAIFHSECIIENNVLFDEIFRPLFPCKICQNVTRVQEVTNLSAEEFANVYAYTGVPVLVKGAMANWSALNTFSFQYFRDLYLPNTEALNVVKKKCQFFPYNTEFKTLGEALNMSDDRAAFKEGEKAWYIGWSNCDSSVRQELRKQYEKPYFLPSDSETTHVDWIFMGGPGKGAGMHIDHVDRPSWQAQVSGTKTWTLAPRPECEGTCYKMEVTVEKGDIIVVDTNMWYHSTFIHPGEISITIGSEYD